MKISDFSSLGARDDASVIPVVSSGANYKQTVSVLLAGYATEAYADALVVGLWDDRGNFDASGGSYPSSGGSGTAGAVKKGDIWTISVAGTLPTGQAVEVGDTVRALIDTPGNTQANWAIGQNNIGYVPVQSVTGTANEITSSGGANPVLSLPAALTFTGKTVTGGTFDNGTLTNAAIGVTNAVQLLDGGFEMIDNGDPTKKGKFEVSGVATGTTRTLNFPNANGTIALTSDLSSYQPLDSDLTAIAGLSPSNDDFLQYKTGAWANRTPTQAAADLQSVIKPKQSFVIACSDETTAITTGTSKVTFRMPYAFTVSEVRASVNTAPTGSTIIIDINESGTTILSTKLSIDASEKTSTTAVSAAVISDSSLADDAEISIDFDQVGSTIAGAGVKVMLIGNRT